MIDTLLQDKGHPAYGKITFLSWAHFLNDGAANYLPGILPAILVSMGLSVSLSGALMAALLIGQGVQPLIGLLADRVGGRAFTIIGLAGSSVAGALIAFAPNVLVLVIILLLLGISNSFFHPQSLVAVRTLSGDRHGSAMSIFLVGGEIGRGVWPLLASLLVMSKGMSSLWILAIPGLLTLPVIPYASIKLPPRNHRVAKVRWRTHLKPLSVLVVFSGLRSLMLYAICTFVPIIWKERGGSLAGGATFILVLMVVGVIGNLAGGHIGDRYNKRLIIAIGLTGAILSMCGFMLSAGIWLWICIALVGVFMFMTFPLTVLIGQDMVPENPSFGSGMALGLSNALGALGVMALGPVAGTWGISAALWTSIACGIIALPLILKLKD